MANTGRPHIQINWTEFDKLCGIHCTLVEISEWFDCSEDTIERAVKREKGMGFAEYYKRKSGRGKISLRRKMFDTAQSGNVTMMIWLSKNMLGYRDQIEEIQEPPTKEDPRKFSFEEFCSNAGYPEPYPKQMEMRKFGIDEIGARLLLGSRGYGKTDYVTLLGAAYKIYLVRDYTILLVTKSKTRNTALLEEMAKALEKNGIELEKQNSEAIRVSGMLGKDPSVGATTIRSASIRGRHPDLVIMDDPVTPEDTSEATRRQVEKTYSEILKLTANVLVLGQPVHTYDLFEKLRPMIKKMELPFGSIPELDPDLEAMALAGVEPGSISASYHLKIISEGDIPFQKVRYMERFPSGGTSVSFIDPSFEGGDYTAQSIVKSYMQGVAVVGFVYKKSWDDCLEEIHANNLKYGVKKLCFETNSLGTQPLDVLRGVLKDVIIFGKKSNGNKHSRIMTAGTFAHMIHLSKESHRKYLDQVSKYEYNCEYDDAPDSLASCLEWLGMIRGKI